MLTAPECKRSVRLGRRPSTSHACEVVRCWSPARHPSCPGGPRRVTRHRSEHQSLVLQVPETSESSEGKRLEICHRQCGRSERDIVLCGGAGGWREEVEGGASRAAGEPTRGKDELIEKKMMKISAQPSGSVRRRRPDFSLRRWSFGRLMPSNETSAARGFTRHSPLECWSHSSESHSLR